ncbi:MAG: ABC transporter ATP-binding protein [Bacteroidota bacterium]|nr:ABC transporter ATP-binding protein [Bacteroidota bacterium]
MSLLDIRNVSKTYHIGQTATHALRDVSVQIEEGEFVTVMGASGSGKSTFLSIAGGLNTPSSGEVVIDGIEMYNLRGDKLSDMRREYIGFVFQSFHLVPYLNVLENVMLPLAPTGLSSKKQTAAARTLLAEVGIAEKEKNLPGELSGGEQQRVAIARALINDPLILLADEPTGNLDTVTSEAVMNLFTLLNGQRKTILMVTHNPAYRSYSTREIEFRDGMIVKDSGARAFAFQTGETVAIGDMIGQADERNGES